MRFLKLNLIAAAMLILGVGSASAYSVTTQTTYNGTDQLAPSDTVTVTVWFNTEGALAMGSPTLPSTRLLMLGVGVMFDDTKLAYDMAASSAEATVINNPTTTPAQNASDFGVASSCPAGYPSYIPQCQLWPAAPAQVQLDFISTGLGSAYGVPTNTAAGGNLLATLVFHVIAPGAFVGDFANINLHFSPNLVNVKPAGVVHRGSWGANGGFGRSFGKLQIRNLVEKFWNVLPKKVIVL
jgi:hypothetical protein